MRVTSVLGMVLVSGFRVGNQFMYSIAMDNAGSGISHRTASSWMVHGWFRFRVRDQFLYGIVMEKTLRHQLIKSTALWVRSSSSVP